MFTKYKPSMDIAEEERRNKQIHYEWWDLIAKIQGTSLTLPNTLQSPDMQFYLRQQAEEFPLQTMAFGESKTKLGLIVLYKLFPTPILIQMMSDDPVVFLMTCHVAGCDYKGFSDGQAQEESFIVFLLLLAWHNYPSDHHGGFIRKATEYGWNAEWAESKLPYYNNLQSTSKWYPLTLH